MEEESGRAAQIHQPDGTMPLKSMLTSHVKLVDLSVSAPCETATMPCFLTLILVNPFLDGTPGWKRGVGQCRARQENDAEAEQSRCKMQRQSKADVEAEQSRCKRQRQSKEAREHGRRARTPMRSSPRTERWSGAHASVPTFILARTPNVHVECHGCK